MVYTNITAIVFKTAIIKYFYVMKILKLCGAEKFNKINVNL